MNKRIFITLAVTLVASAILYKMPSQAAEEAQVTISPETQKLVVARAEDISAADPALAPLVARQRQAGPPERIKQLIAQKRAEREAEDKKAREDFNSKLKQLSSSGKKIKDSEKFIAAKELIKYLDKANARLEKRIRTLESRSKTNTKQVSDLKGAMPTEF